VAFLRLHALETPLDEVAKERRPTGFVLFGAFADAQILPETLGIDSAGLSAREIAQCPVRRERWCLRRR
jgi:hypothetical protein